MIYRSRRAGKNGRRQGTFPRTPQAGGRGSCTPRDLAIGTCSSPSVSATNRTISARCSVAVPANARSRTRIGCTLSRLPDPTGSAEPVRSSGTKRHGEGYAVPDAELVVPLKTLLQRAALAASLALLFGATLRPAGGPNQVALLPWAARQLNAYNVVGNIALLALPAAVLWSFGWPLRRSGFVVSFGIELLQLAIPGRTTATVDVLCNTLGAAVGWLVAASLARRRA